MTTQDTGTVTIPVTRGKLGPPDRFGDLGGKYSLDLSAIISQRYAGEIQGGYRIDLDYQGADQSVRAGTGSVISVETAKLLNGGELLSGSDWVFLDNKGVASFDSRFTLKLNTPLEKQRRCLLEGRIRGRTDLRSVRDKQGNTRFDKKSTDADVIGAWKAGFTDDSWVPLVLSVVFDVPMAGFDDEQNTIYDRCRELGETIYLGVGKARYAFGINSPIKSINLRLYRLGIELAEHLAETGR